MSLEAQMCFVKGVPLRVIDSKNVTCMRVWIWASFSIANFTNTYMHVQNEMLACLFAVCLYQIFDALSLSLSYSMKVATKPTLVSRTSRPTFVLTPASVRTSASTRVVARRSQMHPTVPNT